MVEAEKKKLTLEAWLMVALLVSVVLSTVVIAVVSSNKTTVFSPYESDGEYEEQQLTLMRASLEDFSVANTMSTPMLVNDWQNPHRTLLVIAAPEKPFDAAEASAVHEFVTQRAGKVILASNSTNAQLVAEEFGVKYFDNPVRDDPATGRYYEVTNDNDERITPDTRKLWSVASVTRDVSSMGEEKAVPCSEDDVREENVDNCRMPVLFHRPTAIQVLDEQADEGREVKVLAAASTSAEIDANKGESNPNLGEGETGLVIRIDYPGQKVLDQRSLDLGGDIGEISATGSIVFVSDHSVLANHLWDQDYAQSTGKKQCDSVSGLQVYTNAGHMCWDTDSEGLNKALGDTTWRGNEAFFTALINDMMEFDNDELSATIARNTGAFNIVFDESRHVSGSLSMPFTEAMGAIVLLTSDGVLKWLIILNLFALLAIAIMVVPEKENWRHVFDLTRFRERPTKLDPSQYQRRTREAFLAKVRNFNDLTRDEFARKSPAEVMQMIREPRLVELVSSNRAYSNDELREIIPHIRRWGN